MGIPDVRVGIIGTGYAAKQRLTALLADGRVTVVGVAGRQRQRVETLTEGCGATAFIGAEALLKVPDLDLVFICGVNQAHAECVQQALELGRHVVVEYPLALDLEQALFLINYARSRQRLLHVEHIELLSGVQTLLRQHIPKLGEVFAIHYTTITATRPAPDRWTYQTELFGFPLLGAVSRLHRLIDLWGAVQSVYCQVRYHGAEMPRRFRSCHCVAQLQFANGIPATVVYGKGESFWRSQRTLDVQGSLGGLFVDDDIATLVQGTEAQPLDTGSRLGLFALDTQMVLDHLFEQKPLYVQPEQLVHTLAVAWAAQRSAETGQTMGIDGVTVVPVG
ncbi:MAG: Gfo/Idh/MocA family oxidoreductase [Synechococcales cyanobacterium]